MEGVQVPNPLGTPVVAVSIVQGNDEVNQPCSEWTRMESRRLAPRTLMGGTHAMREAGQAFLPKKLAESADAYKTRLNHSTLFNAFGRAAQQLAGKVFHKPVALHEPSDDVEEWAENIDLQGNALDVFARTLFESAITEGLGFILVDYPVKEEGEAITNVADWRKSGQRPYWVMVKAQQVIGWRSTVVSGVRKLTQVRILETVTEEHGDFGEKEVQQVRVLTPGHWALWRKDAESGKWGMTSEGDTTLDFVPLVPLNLCPRGFFVADPPLQDLADLNIKHWQSSSSQDHILDYVRFPFLFGKCLGLEPGQELVISPNGMIRSESGDADIRHVEHTGASISAGRTSLQDLEAQMALLSMEPMLQQQSGNITATKTAVDTSSASSLLMSWAVALKDTLETALKFMGAYVGVEEPGEVALNFDFVLSLSSSDGTLLLQAYQAKAISRETFLREMVRRGVFSDDMDMEADAQKIEEEADAALERQAEQMKRMGALTPSAKPAPKPAAPAKGGASSEE